MATQPEAGDGNGRSTNHLLYDAPLGASLAMNEPDWAREPRLAGSAKNGDHLQIDQDELERSAPSVAELLGLLNATNAEMVKLFGELARDPSRYASVRSELEQLEAERKSHLLAVGEHASKFMAVRRVQREAEAGPTADVEDEPIATAPVEQHVDAPAASPSCPGDIEAFRAAYGSDPTQRAPNSGEKGALLNLAQFVQIADAGDASLSIYDEVDALERATSPSRVAQWAKLSPTNQVRWLSVLVAWAKALEGETERSGIRSQRTGDAFRRLRNYSREYDPGFIHGFARDAEPKLDTWRATAIDLLREIKGNPVRTPTSAPPSSRRRGEDDDRDESDTSNAVPDDWAYLHHVKAKRVVMIGGETREQRRVAIQRSFQFATLEWIANHRPRQLQSLAERAARKSVDLILVNKFVAHAETAMLERQSSVPLIVVRSGYGIAAVRAALESHFARLDGGRSGASARDD